MSTSPLGGSPGRGRARSPASCDGGRRQRSFRPRRRRRSLRGAPVSAPPRARRAPRPAPGGAPGRRPSSAADDANGSDTTAAKRPPRARPGSGGPASPTSPGAGDGVDPPLAPGGPRCRSRLGGALLIGGVAVVLLVVLIIVLSGGGDDKGDKGGSSNTTSTAASSRRARWRRSTSSRLGQDARDRAGPELELGAWRSRSSPRTCLRRRSHGVRGVALTPPPARARLGYTPAVRQGRQAPGRLGARRPAPAPTGS